MLAVPVGGDRLQASLARYTRPLRAQANPGTPTQLRRLLLAISWFSYASRAAWPGQEPPWAVL